MHSKGAIPMTIPNVESFVSDLEQEIRAKKLSLVDADFLHAVERKEVTRAQIGEWAKVFYAATRHGRLTIGNFYANAPDDSELRRELAENIFEEETGGISGVGRCHMDVFEDLLEAFEITPEEAATLKSPMGDHLPQGHAISPFRTRSSVSA
jgi:pyrroloquinoline quinone (PQQ) biosynthesis protein C